MLIFFGIILTNSGLAQDKSFMSKTNKVTIANGFSVNVTNEKKIYFEINLQNSCPGNDCGQIVIADGIMHSGQNINYEKFKIYSLKLNDNGIYDYWAIDVTSGDQIVLFEVDNNSAVATLTISRYSPIEKNKVLKRIIYDIN